MTRNFKWTKEDGDFICEFPDCDIVVWDNENSFYAIDGMVSGMEIDDGNWNKYTDAFILFDIAGQHFDKVIIECIKKVFDGNIDKFRDLICSCDNVVTLDIDDILNIMIGRGI